MNHESVGEVCPEKAGMCLLSPANHIYLSHTTIDGYRSHLRLSPFSTLSYRHNILWGKIIDMQTESFYVSPIRK
jgi:hypothetical protein